MRRRAARSRASIKTLGVDHFDVLHLHDPEFIKDITDVTGPEGSMVELMKMKEEGFCDAVGLGAGDVDVMMPLLRDWDFDVVLTHNRFTLINRNAEPMIDYALSRGMAVLNAAPYGGGVFAKGSCGDAEIFVSRRACRRSRRREAGRGGVRTRTSRRELQRCSSRCAIRASPSPSAASAGRSGRRDDRVGQLADPGLRSGKKLAAIPYSTDNPQAQAARLITVKVILRAGRKPSFS